MKRSTLLAATGLTAAGLAATAFWLASPGRDFNTLTAQEKQGVLLCLRSAVTTMPRERISAELNSMMAKDPRQNPALVPPEQAIALYARATLKLAAQDCTAAHDVDPQTLPLLRMRIHVAPGVGGPGQPVLPAHPRPRRSFET